MYQHVSYDVFFQRKERHTPEAELAIERRKNEEERENSRKLRLEVEKLQAENDRLRKVVKNCKCCVDSKKRREEPGAKRGN